MKIIKTLLMIVGIPIFGCGIFLVMLITVRFFVEARYLPASSMEPTMHVHDRVLVEKVKKLLHRPYIRGEIIVFYPPPLVTGGKDHSYDLPHIMGRLTGLKFFPNEPAFIKRVIGLPGDRIVVRAGQGVFINGQLLPENYVKDKPAYSLHTLADLVGQDFNYKPIAYETDPAKKDLEIVVPKDHLFVLGDNRNNSEDSHCWGFLPQDRIIGRAMVLMRTMEHLKYPLLEPKKEPLQNSLDPET